MNLVFDIGNSSTKMALFNGEEIVLSLRTKDVSYKKLQELIIKYRREIKRAIISSTKPIPEFVPDLLSLNFPELVVLSADTKLPFAIDYTTPETLGTDRIAAVAGVFHRFNGGDTLIIDAGSAITFDYLCDRRFVGGNISPGINIRLKSLHRYTSKLPLVFFSGNANTPGRNTDEAIEAGVIFGIVYEINEYIRTFLVEHPGANIVLTGGDAVYLKDKLSFPVVFMPDVVITGLNYILEDNAK